MEDAKNMKQVAVCRGCGRTIESDFIYCPWCGFSRAASDDNDSLETVFHKLEVLQRNSHMRRISEAGKQIDNLVSELDTLVLEHKTNNDTV